MDKTKLEDLVVSEKDAGKAKALADMVVAKERSESDIETARLKSEADLEKAKADIEKSRVEQIRIEKEYEMNMARIEMEREKFKSEKEANLAKVEADKLRTATEENTEKKGRILKLILAVVSAISTIGLTLFSVFNHNRQDDKKMYFEETGSLRSSTWKTKRDSIEKVDVTNVR